MTADGATATGALALATVVLLPGLVIVRAPWTAVPFLSLSFWVVTWWWLPAHLGRGRFVVGALGGFATLAALRLLKAVNLRFPAWPTAFALTAAAFPLFAAGFFTVTPGAGMSRSAVGTLLSVWRDGPPVSGEPLLPLAPYPSDIAGFAGVAADVALLSGISAYRAASLTAAAALGLLHIAVFALLARLVARPVAALATVTGLALLGWPNPATALATACLLSATALLVRGTGRSPAVAAGTFLAAALEADAAVALALLLLLPLAVLMASRAAAAERRAVLGRFALAGGVAAALAVPFLRSASASLWPQPQAFLPLASALLALALACVGAALASRRASARVAMVAALAVAVAGAAGRVFCPGSRAPLSADDLEAMAWIRGHTQPLDVVCADPGTPAAEWIPAVAERAITPAVGRPCALAYSGRSGLSAPGGPHLSSGGPGGPAPHPGVVFRNATVTILKAP